MSALAAKSASSSSAEALERNFDSYSMDDPRDHETGEESRCIGYCKGDNNGSDIKDQDVKDDEDESEEDDDDESVWGAMVPMFSGPLPYGIFHLDREEEEEEEEGGKGEGEDGGRKLGV
eukprot:g5337.t1